MDINKMDFSKVPFPITWKSPQRLQFGVGGVWYEIPNGMTGTLNNEEEAKSYCAKYGKPRDAT